MTAVVAARRCYRCGTDAATDSPICARCAAVWLPAAGFPARPTAAPGARQRLAPGGVLLPLVLAVAGLLLLALVLAVQQFTGGDSGGNRLPGFGSGPDPGFGLPPFGGLTPDRTTPADTAAAYSTPAYTPPAVTSTYETPTYEPPSDTATYDPPSTDPATDPATTGAGPVSPPPSAPATGPLDDTWVVQLASIPLADAATVPTRTATIQARLGRQVYALNSADFADLRPGFIVLYSPGSFADGSAALAVCTAAGIADTDCFGRYLSHDPADRPYACHQPDSPVASRCEHG